MLKYPNRALKAFIKKVVEVVVPKSSSKKKFAYSGNQTRYLLLSELVSYHCTKCFQAGAVFVLLSYIYIYMLIIICSLTLQSTAKSFTKRLQIGCFKYC